MASVVRLSGVVGVEKGFKTDRRLHGITLCRLQSVDTKPHARGPQYRHGVNGIQRLRSEATQHKGSY